MELTERERDVIRLAVWRYAGMNDRWGDSGIDHTDWCHHHSVDPTSQAIARDLYFRFSHELV